MTTQPQVRERRPITAPATRSDHTGRAIVLTFVVVPTLALAAAIPVAARLHWISWHDVVLGIIFYAIGCFGISAGYHRCFAHPSWKPVIWLRVALGIAGSTAIEGSVLTWCADHRRHHEYSDVPGAPNSESGDPHSPWRFGTTWQALLKGFIYAHVGWILAGREPTNQQTYIPDLLKQKHMVRVNNTFILWVVLSLATPPLLGYLWGGHTLHAALTALFWAGLVRVGLMHHVTWCINSVCHMFGRHDFDTARGEIPADHSGNVWWLALLSAGESQHNGHHGFPASYRHGLLKWQLDPTARFIWLCWKLKLASNLIRPDPDKLKAKQLPNKHGVYRRIKPAFLLPVARAT